MGLLRTSFCFFYSVALLSSQSEPKAACGESQSKPVSVSLSESASPSDQCHVYLLYQRLLLFLLESLHLFARPFLSFSCSLSPLGLRPSLFPPAFCLSQFFLWTQFSTIQSLWAKSLGFQVLGGTLTGLEGCLESVMAMSALPPSFPLFSPFLSSSNCVSFLHISIPCFFFSFCITCPVVALSEVTSSRDRLTPSPAYPAAPHSVRHSVNMETSFQPVLARLSVLPSCCSFPAIAVTCTWLLSFLPQRFRDCFAGLAASVGENLNIRNTFEYRPAPTPTTTSRVSVNPNPWCCNPNSRLRG